MSNYVWCKQGSRVRRVHVNVCVACPKSEDCREFQETQKASGPERPLKSAGFGRQTVSPPV